MIIKRKRYIVVEEDKGEWCFVNRTNNKTKAIPIKNVGNSELQLYVHKKNALNALWNNKPNKVLAVNVTFEIFEEDK